MTAPPSSGAAAFLAILAGTGGLMARASLARAQEFGFRSEIRLGSALGVTFDDDGERAILTPRFELRYALSPRWRLDAAWALAILYDPDGRFSIPGVEEEERTDDIPRAGNPFIELRHAAVRASSGFAVDVGLGVALPVASIPKPDPPEGPEFERSPQTERAYRRALAANGFRAPWAFFWDTATVLGSARVRQVKGPVTMDVEAEVGLLIPAGRLRATVGALLGLEAYAGVDLDLAEIGMRASLAYVTPQRDEFRNTLQLRGGQLALAPELTADLYGPLYLQAAFVVSAGVELEPFPDEAVWGLQVDLGARF